MDIQSYLENPVLIRSLSALCVFWLVLSALAVVKKALWKRLRAWADRTPTKWDDEVMDALGLPVRVLMVLVALLIGIQFGPSQLKEHVAVVSGAKALFVLSLFWTVGRAGSAYIRAGEFPTVVTQSTRVLLISVFRIVVFSLGLLMVLDTLGISITPVLASLGVGSVAVALAAQDTLSNFFSGVYLLIDRPIRLDDYVKVDDHIEGFVKKIGWRSTQIQLLSDNTVVIPNTKLSSSVVTNFHLPEKELGIGVQVGVAYESDLEKVEKVTIEVAKEVLATVPGGVKNFEPSVRFHTFADSSINFSVALRALEFVDSFRLKHEFIKALHKRYLKEGISIPYPQRVVHMEPVAAISPGVISGKGTNRLGLSE